MGLSMSTLFLVYTGTSRSRRPSSRPRRRIWASASTATPPSATFSGFGTFLIMGVVGLLVAMLVNMFLQSSAMALAISAIGVLLFAGLTAYDTQRIKSMYFQVPGTEMAGKTVIMGALSSTWTSSTCSSSC